MKQEDVENDEEFELRYTDSGAPFFKQRFCVAHILSQLQTIEIKDLTIEEIADVEENQHQEAATA